MQNLQFEQIVNEQLDLCKNLLIQKSYEYDSDTRDRLHSFKAAANLQGISNKQALAGMLCKHTVSIFDMCQNGDYPIEKWTEKISDHINYLLLLKALVIEEEENSVKL